ncbi:MAG: hypothetical protein Q8T13_20075 [Acidobacteriota bacterium]|nr:hypothetical protein [Acidobacteriota bacterium]
MRAAGELPSDEHKQRCVTLRTAFKALVKGRELEGGRTDTWSLVATTGLTDNWIFNAMDARFLAHEWPRDYVDVDFRSGGRDIRVPANFGMQRPWGMEAGPILPMADL